jgi:transposase-like protein
MEKEYDKCPYCNSTNFKPILKESLKKYECESCGAMFGGKGMPPDGTPG